jgi:hypothetical protein
MILANGNANAAGCNSSNLNSDPKSKLSNKILKKCSSSTGGICMPN